MPTARSDGIKTGGVPQEKAPLAGGSAVDAAAAPDRGSAGKGAQLAAQQQLACQRAAAGDDQPAASGGGTLGQPRAGVPTRGGGGAKFRVVRRLDQHEAWAATSANAGSGGSGAPPPAPRARHSPAGKGRPPAGALDFLSPSKKIKLPDMHQNGVWGADTCIAGQMLACPRTRSCLACLLPERRLLGRSRAGLVHCTSTWAMRPMSDSPLPPSPDRRLCRLQPALPASQPAGAAKPGQPAAR